MKCAWENKDINKITEFCEGYKKFISENKTERECVQSIKKLAEDAGFKDLKKLVAENKKVKAGDKVYAINLDKCIMLFVVGKEPISKGLRILGSHIDSPRLDLKPTPLYEENISELALFDTHYYGGIKAYQWTTIPLALRGVVCKKDCTTVKINIGDNAGDPVFCISDLLPHLEDKTRKDNKIKNEKLDIIIAGIPDFSVKSEKVKSNVLKILNNMGISESDFISAEIEAVPHGSAKDMGFDKSFVLGYGQDDRISAYTSLMAFLEVINPKYTTASLFVDKEEIGSVGASGMQSLFFEDMLAELIALTNETSHLAVRRGLRNSCMISSDVTAGYDPNYTDAFDKNNDSFLGRGISFCKYTGSRGKSGANDASPEYIAKLRKLLDEKQISYQLTEMGKVDQGGGGTIAYITGNYGMNVIDCGCPLLNMHAPFEVSSKVDIFEAYRCYKAFLEME